MKQFLAAVLVAILVLPSPVLAHSGGTDSSGGHYNSATGNYHYHHGHEAHDHPGGICPYDPDAQPERNPVTFSGVAIKVFGAFKLVAQFVVSYALCYVPILLIICLVLLPGLLKDLLLKLNAKFRNRKK